MKIGIIGTGKIAGTLAIAINSVEGVELFAVSSRILSKSRAFAEKYNATLWYEGTKEFYENKEIDLVYIATPNSRHLEDTKEALNNNKAVLCEKPFALNKNEALEMIKLAKDKNLLLVEAMWTKYFPGIHKVKEVLESGALGDIVSIHGDLSYLLDKDIKRLYEKKMGGGALLDLGVYPISLTHYFLGYPDKIQSSGHFSNSGIDLTTSIIFNYKNGATALLSCSIIASSTSEFIISCTNGWIRINGSFHHPTSISCFVNGKGEEHQEFPRTGYGYEYQIQGLCDDFNKGLKESSTVKLQDTVEIMQIMDTIRDQIGLDFNE
ncbi:MAG: Gfo/Idh/MocA family oxidoreductase [Spirochaetaceae bacterium]